MNAELLWPRDQVETLANELAAVCQLATPAPVEPSDEADFTARAARQARRLGVELVRCHEMSADLERTLRVAGPAILPARVNDADGLLALIGHRRGKLELLGPGLTRTRVAIGQVAAWMRGPVEAQLATRLTSAPLARLPPRARRALVRSLGAHETIGPICLLSSGAIGSQVAMFRRSALASFIGFAAASLLQSLAWVIAFWFLGVAALRGNVDTHLLGAFPLVLATYAFFRLAAAWYEGRCALALGVVLRRTTLGGALAVSPERVRRLGIGQLMGRAIETESIERLAATGGLAAINGAIDCLIAGGVFAMAGAPAGLLFWVLCLAATALLARAHYLALRVWTDQRLALTHDLIEKLVGHRTRLVQLPRAAWNDGEDRRLSEYVVSSERLDRREAWLEAGVPRAALVVGLFLCGLLLVGGATSIDLAISLGGVLLLWRGLETLGLGLPSLFAAKLAWDRARDLLATAPRSRELPIYLGRAAPGEPIVRAKEAGFIYPDRSRPAVDKVDLEVRRGQKVLLRGPSGSGKSTVAALLSGEELATSGAVRLHGIDRASLGGETWQERVVLVPQFHLNHVFADTLAFNLFLGGSWPPSADELAHAESLLRELGLGAVLDRMPSGLFTRVGDSGWQLSHGEQSRLFVARALLQDPEVVLFDESLAALDPETLSECLIAIRRHVETCVVIAHP